MLFSSVTKLSNDMHYNELLAYMLSHLFSRFVFKEVISIVTCFITNQKY